MWKWIMALTSAGLLLSVSIAIARDAADESNAPRKLDNVLNERVAVLREIAKLRRAAHNRGEAKLDACLVADVDVLEAELELAQDPEKRIALLQQLLSVARKRERIMQELARTNEVTDIDALRAKASRLKAEARLLREQT
jgi:hypothetical protein